MQKHSFGIRGLSVFLAILIAVFVVPVSVYADALESIGNDETVETPIEEENTALTRLSAEVFEDTSLREGNVKHFRLADGSYIAYAYGMPIHTRGEDGLWQDIDNTLTASGDSYVTPGARVKFAKKITGNEALFTLHDGNRKLTMSLDGAIKKTKGVAVNTETQLDESADLLQKLTTLDKLTSRITYYGILSGVDLEYVVDGVNVKENIIVNEKQDAYTYSFTLALNNLEATLLPDGAVIIEDADTGETVYTVPAPTVFDADGIAAPDGAAYYTLTQSGNKSYTLAVTVSADWMNSADRAFPVTVDPPIYSSLPSQMQDTYIDSLSPVVSNGNGAQLCVGNTESGAREYIGFWKMTSLPTIPDQAVVVSGSLSLYCVSFYTTFLPYLYIGLYESERTFSESGTWTTLAPTGDQSDTTKMIDYNCLTEASENKFITWDITQAAEKWYQNESNNGIYLRAVNATNEYVLFTSRENASNRPYCEINYRRINGIEKYWTYSTQNASLAGIGNIHMGTGKLSFTFSTWSTEDGIMPYTPYLVYNANQKDADWDAFCPEANLETNTGLGWKLDSQQALFRRNYYNECGETEAYFVWLDADGTEHAFLPHTTIPVKLFTVTRTALA